VALTLEEAEHLRASMHLLRQDNWPATVGLALRFIGGKESSIDDSLLDEAVVPHFQRYGPCMQTAEQAYQTEVVEQILRFTNCSVGFQSRELNILLRSLQHTKVEQRLPWWLGIRSCRRRAQTPHEQLPIAKVFAKADEFDELASKALLSRFRFTLAAMRLWPADAFHTLDTDKDGSLSKGELVNGLIWLGLNKGQRFQQNAEKLFKFIDKDSNKVISMDEFKAAMELDEFDWESVPSAARPTTGPQAVKTEVTASTATVKLTADMCRQKRSGRFELTWVKHANFNKVWDTSGTFADNSISIWEPSNLEDIGFFGEYHRVVIRICMGHFVSKSLDAPSGDFAKALEVKDNQESGLFAGRNRESLNAFVKCFFPKPVRFRKIWSQSTVGSRSKELHMWLPVPPSEDFVSVGTVATTTDVEPSVDTVNCVPKYWVEKADASKLWMDSGTGGTPAHFWGAKKEIDERTGSARFIVTSGSKAKEKPDLVTMPTDVRSFFSELPRGAK